MLNWLKSLEKLKHWLKYESGAGSRPSEPLVERSWIEEIIVLKNWREGGVVRRLARAYASALQVPETTESWKLVDFYCFV